MADLCTASTCAWAHQDITQVTAPRIHKNIGCTNTKVQWPFGFCKMGEVCAARNQDSFLKATNFLTVSDTSASIF